MTGPARRGLAAVPEGATARRAWTIKLHPGLELLNANHRGHWTRRNEVTRELRGWTAMFARRLRIPNLARAHILAIYQPPDARRRDPANLYPSFKACIDGLVDAGVLPDDDAAHLDGPDMRLGQVFPRGRLVLVITDRGAGS